jgi:acetyltransferase-like isoleucine patch superfamily enzyme
LPGRLRKRLQDALEWRLRTGWFARVTREAVLRHPLVFGPGDRVQIGEQCDLSGATLNTMSGRIVIGSFTFVGHHVSLLTGTHDHRRRNRERYDAVPAEGRDIVIGEGVWLASNCTVLGPCRIGDHAVVAAGALVTDDVPAGAIVAGVPARHIADC